MDYFPPKYKRMIMEVLVSYQDLLTKKEKESGIRRNVGWKRLSEEVLISVGRKKFQEVDVISLKNAIEAHISGRSTISDIHFRSIERFVCGLDLQDLTRGARTSLACSRLDYISEAFDLFLGRGLSLKELGEPDTSLLGYPLLLSSASAGMIGHYDAVVQFAPTLSRRLLCVCLFFAGNFERFFDDERNAGVCAAIGVAGVQSIDRPLTSLVQGESRDVVLSGWAMVPVGDVPTTNGAHFVGFSFKLSGVPSQSHRAFEARRIPIPSSLAYYDVSGYEKHEFSLLIDQESFSGRAITNRHQVSYVSSMLKSLVPEVQIG